MDQVLEFLKGLGVVQWALIAGGIFLMWPKLSELLVGLVVEKKDEVPVSPETIDEVPGDKDLEYNLLEIVSRWESLSDCCDDHEVHDACDKLQEIFPLLVKPYSKDH